MSREKKDTAEVLASPAVSSEVYDTDYYLHWCAGSENWVHSEGVQPDALYPGSLAKARLAEGDVLLDIGTGRGELVAVAVGMGARHAIGIEYSFDALELARKTVLAAGITPGAPEATVSLLAADSRQIPLNDNSVDLVTLLDVVEHLTVDELHRTLIEARRVLRPGGRVFAHTLPSRTIYNVTYRLQRLALPTRWRRWPADPRVELEHKMHVNEQSRASLGKALRRADFTKVSVERGQIVYAGFVPDEGARKLYPRLARFRLTAGLAIADLWAEGTAPS
jgi:SAM-dependent methyltransferase